MTLPANLPDSRTAQRLLDILTHLEYGLRLNRHSSGAATTELEMRLANLQFENQRLRSTRSQAVQRLDTLIHQLQQQLDVSGQPHTSFTHALDHLVAEDETAQPPVASAESHP